MPRLACTQLRRAGIAFSARCVQTRAAFTRALDEFAPDVVLADFRLPAFDGGTALELARRARPELPVIIVSGHLSDAEAVELLGAGASDFVLKDRLARLAPAVRRALEGAREHRLRLAGERDRDERLTRTQAQLAALAAIAPSPALANGDVWPIRENVWQHHERLDGSGYPRGLQGDAILLESRILAVADVLEAVASHRPYRPARGTAAALQVIVDGRGTHFDERVADACVRRYGNGQPLSATPAAATAAGAHAPAGGSPSCSTPRSRTAKVLESALG